MTSTHRGLSTEEALELGLKEGRGWTSGASSSERDGSGGEEVSRQRDTSCSVTDSSSSSSLSSLSLNRDGLKCCL